MSEKIHHGLLIAFQISMLAAFIAMILACTSTQSIPTSTPSDGDSAYSGFADSTYTFDSYSDLACEI